MSERLNRAINLAVTYHNGQVDKAGKPYILHVLRVGAMGENESEMILGFLHDLLEDTNITPFEIQTLFGPEILTHLDILTRRKGVFYQDYIEKIGLNPLCTNVKINDLIDNVVRTSCLANKSEARSLAVRYRKALAYLSKRKQFWENR